MNVHSGQIVLIGGVTIPRDEAGRFNLNALHKASKLGEEKAPAKWLRNKQTSELIAELEEETGRICLVSAEGRNGGTFADQLLAVSYAGWISPSFQLHVNQAFIDVKAGAISRLPDFSNPVAAARAWADQVEARQLAEQTKAQIGSRREATAMNTASQAVKKVTRLEIELDRSRQYASVKRMSILYHGQQFSWRLLKQASVEMGIPSIEVFDANYGTVKAYHADVWREAYALDIPTTDGSEESA